MVLSIWLIVPAVPGLIASLSNYAPIEPSVQWIGLRSYEANRGRSDVRGGNPECRDLRPGRGATHLIKPMGGSRPGLGQNDPGR